MADGRGFHNRNPRDSLRRWRSTPVKRLAESSTASFLEPVKIKISARYDEVFELPTPWLISDRMLAIGRRQFRIMTGDSMSRLGL